MFSVIVISFLFAVTLTIAATLSFKEKVDPVGLVCAAFAVPAFLLSYFLTSSASRGYPVSIDDAKRRSIYRVVDQFPNGNHFFIAAIPEDGGDAVRVFGVEDTIPS